MKKKEPNNLINSEFSRRQFLEGMAKTTGGTLLAGMVGFSFIDSAKAATAKYGGTLKWASPSYPKSFDPTMATLQDELPLVRLVYNPLVCASGELA